MFIQKGVFIGNWTPIQAFMVPVIEHKAVFVLNTVTLLIPYVYVERKDCRAIFLAYRPIKFCFSLHAVFLVGKFFINLFPVFLAVLFNSSQISRMSHFHYKSFKT